MAKEENSELFVSDTTLALCRMPLDRSALRNVSPVELVKRSGYLRNPGEASVPKLVACLARTPDLIDLWIRWSEDWRGSPQWYIERLHGGGFEVGYFRGNGKPTSGPADGQPIRLEDPILAVATYVHNHVATLAESAGVRS
jgi:hypothetical protein